MYTVYQVHLEQFYEADNTFITPQPR